MDELRIVNTDETFECRFINNDTPGNFEQILELMREYNFTMYNNLMFKKVHGELMGSVFIQVREDKGVQRPIKEIVADIDRWKQRYSDIFKGS